MFLTRRNLFDRLYSYLQDRTTKAAIPIKIHFVNEMSYLIWEVIFNTLTPFLPTTKYLVVTKISVVRCALDEISRVSFHFRTRDISSVVIDFWIKVNFRDIYIYIRRDISSLVAKGLRDAWILQNGISFDHEHRFSVTVILVCPRAGGTSRSLGISTCPKLCLYCTHHTDNQSMSCTVKLPGKTISMSSPW